MKEIDAQSMLIKSIKLNNGYGHKSSNPFIQGLPDIFIAHPDAGQYFSEVKIGKLLRTGDVSWTGTDPQKRCLRDMVNAGQWAFWTIIWKDDKSWMLRAAHPVTLEWLTPTSMTISPVGLPKGWPTLELMIEVRRALLNLTRTRPHIT